MENVFITFMIRNFHYKIATSENFQEMLQLIIRIITDTKISLSQS